MWNTLLDLATNVVAGAATTDDIVGGKIPEGAIRPVVRQELPVPKKLLRRTYGDQAAPEQARAPLESYRAKKAIPVAAPLARAPASFQVDRVPKPRQGPPPPPDAAFRESLRRSLKKSSPNQKAHWKALLLKKETCMKAKSKLGFKIPKTKHSAHLNPLVEKEGKVLKLNTKTLKSKLSDKKAVPTAKVSDVVTGEALPNLRMGKESAEQVAAVKNDASQEPEIEKAEETAKLSNEEALPLSQDSSRSESLTKFFEDLASDAQKATEAKKVAAMTNPAGLKLPLQLKKSKKKASDSRISDPTKSQTLSDQPSAETEMMNEQSAVPSDEVLEIPPPKETTSLPKKKIISNGTKSKLAQILESKETLKTHPTAVSPTSGHKLPTKPIAKPPPTLAPITLKSHLNKAIVADSADVAAAHHTKPEPEPSLAEGLFASWSKAASEAYSQAATAIQQYTLTAPDSNEITASKSVIKSGPRNDPKSSQSTLLSMTNAKRKDSLSKLKKSRTGTLDRSPIARKATLPDAEVKTRAATKATPSESGSKIKNRKEPVDEEMESDVAKTLSQIPSTARFDGKKAKPTSKAISSVEMKNRQLATLKSIPSVDKAEIESLRKPRNSVDAELAQSRLVVNSPGEPFSHGVDTRLIIESELATLETERRLLERQQPGAGSLNKRKSIPSRRWNEIHYYWESCGLVPLINDVDFRILDNMRLLDAVQLRLDRQLSVCNRIAHTDIVADVAFLKFHDGARWARLERVLFNVTYLSPMGVGLRALIRNNVEARVVENYVDARRTKMTIPAVHILNRVLVKTRLAWAFTHLARCTVSVNRHFRSEPSWFSTNGVPTRLAGGTETFVNPIKIRWREGLDTQFEDDCEQKLRRQRKSWQQKIISAFSEVANLSASSKTRHQYNARDIYEMTKNLPYELDRVNQARLSRRFLLQASRKRRTLPVNENVPRRLSLFKT